jgi:two-component system, sensor histidine kinase and response regulator
MMAAVADESIVSPMPSMRRRRPVREIKSRVPEALRERTRILLVEDNLVNQQVALRMIERMGYKAEAVENGREALDTLAHSNYDVVLMDCQMPEMDGYSATREFRRREGASRHTTIIGVTAHALTGDRDDCLKAGMDDYLAKPVTPQDMVEVLDRWVMTVNHLPINGTTNSESADRADADKPTIDEQVLAQLREFERPGESSFVNNLIGMFLSDLTTRLEEIRAALAVADASRINRAAHALKGASGELGAARLRELCGRLEAQTVSQSAEGVEGLICVIEEEAARVRSALQAQKLASVATSAQSISSPGLARA